MSLGRRFAAVAAIVALAATPMAAWSQAAAPTLEQFKAAQTAYVTRITEAQAGRATYPRLNDPKIGPTMRTAMDNRALSLVNFSDVAAGLQVCAPPALATQAYVVAGLADPESALTAPTADQQLQIGRNAALYRDELSLSLSFMVDCFGRMMGPLATFWTSLDEPTRAARRSGVVQIRDGSGQVYEGGITMLSEATYSPQNKEQVLSALMRNGAAFAGVMTPAHRSRIVATIDKTGAGAPADMRPRLAQLRATFAQTACTGLCAV
ncbi:MAG: hypothetical protein JWR84_2604 [Caulobacter sp.]|nr:hypothetical protein [Caulobacter sp.]